MADLVEKQFLDFEGTTVLVNQIKKRPTKEEVDNAISSSLGNVDLSAYAKAADVARDYQTKGDYSTKTEMQQAITDAISTLRTEIQNKLQELYDSITSVDSQAISDTLKSTK